LAVGGVFPQRPFRPTSSPTTTWAEQQVSDEFPAVQTHLILVAATSAAGRQLPDDDFIVTMPSWSGA